MFNACVPHRKAVGIHNKSPLKPYDRFAERALAYGR
jgi:hypothetical protein